MGIMVIAMSGSYEDVQGVQDSLAAGGWQTEFLTAAGEGRWVAVFRRADQQQQQHQAGREQAGQGQGDGQQQQQQHRKQVK